MRNRLRPEPFALLALSLALAAACAPGSQSVRGSARPAAHAGPVNSRSASDDDATTPAGFTDADFARHVAQLRKRLPSEEFAVVIERPFVVVGDGGRRAVEEHARGTVKWTVDLLKRDFFTKDPKEILDIWLFKDEASYRKHARRLFGSDPTTPYGYYSPANKALVMNISTGGGTLVHEIVHPFIEANFPNCPPWLNEGLGSLYEQSGERDGHIRGFTNWRLPGLQQAIRGGGLTPFKTLLAMDARTFYDEDKGTNYAQSRYLCYYLQERGLLVTFYREFFANRASDPTGFDTLKTVLGERDIDAFQQNWERFVLGLSQ
ncbi:MAG: hypothetical protein QOJ76_723 [Acidobacteriota bacterium]|jgi:hypothetical protein|nr:hypothetical protein [Acidobacteriota bacterium]